MLKITIAELDVEQALAGIECPKIIRKAIWHLWRTGSLELMVLVLITSGKESNIDSAIKFQVAELMKKKREKVKVNLSDLQNLPQTNALQKKLYEVLGKEVQKKHADRSRVFGVKSHVTIPKLFSGEFIRIEHKQKEKNSNIGEQGLLPFESGMFPAEAPKVTIEESVSPSSKHVVRHISQTIVLWKKIVATLKYDLFPLHSTNYDQLLANLKLVFGQDLLEVMELGKRDSESEYFAFTTFLTWVTALAAYQERGSIVLFKELALLPYRYDVGLGRIDAIAVDKINGVAPNEKQTEILKRLAREKYDSVGHLILQLVQAFGSGIELAIYDWKFAVGDGPNGIKRGLNIIKSKDIEICPFDSHKNQMDRYISSALISYAFAAYAEMKNPESIWKSDHFDIRGEIHYFLPNVMPKVYKIELTDEEKMEVFRIQVVQNYVNARYRSDIRNLSNTLLRQTIEIVESGKMSVDGDSEQLVMKEVLSSTPKKHIRKLIDHFVERKYMDEYGIVEHVGFDAKKHPKHKMHLDRLLEEINKGNIKVDRRFNVVTGGKICCPVHGERTPSFVVNFKRGFKCFGCGVGGTFSMESVPSDLEQYVQPINAAKFKKSFGEIEKFTLPERHEQAMKAAQRILQNQFLDSPGAKYLKEVRRLNPELSMKIGAGFGSDRVVPYLLDHGFSYSELVEYGFFNFSNRVKEDSSLVQMLISRGMTLSEIERDVEIVVDKKPVMVPGLPIFILLNRVTYPLDIQGKITGFYGRSIDPNCRKEFAHQKTRCETVPQGGFNITNAMAAAIRRSKSPDKPPVLGMTESPIDVDTFIQKSDLKEFGGWVGVNNKILYEIVSQFPGTLITANDFDDSRIDEKGVERGRTGQRNTLNFVEYLQAVEFQHAVYDFSAPMAAKYPGYKDINKFCVEQEIAYEKYHKVIISPEVLYTKVRIL